MGSGEDRVDHLSSLTVSSCRYLVWRGGGAKDEYLHERSKAVLLFLYYSGGASCACM